MKGRGVVGAACEGTLGLGSQRPRLWLWWRFVIKHWSTSIEALLIAVLFTNLSSATHKSKQHRSSIMSFLGGPECSTGANPLAQFQKQTGADTSLQRDRLTQRAPGLQGFRNQQQSGPQDAAFHDFQQQGPGFTEGLPQDTAYLEQLEREHARFQANGGGGGGNGWAGEFAQQPPTFSPEQFAQQTRNGTFNPQDFASFRSQAMSPLQQSPMTQTPATSVFQRSPMYGSNFGGGFGRFQQPMYQSSPMQFEQQQYEGKGKGRVQELSDTDWEKQFEELSTQDKEQDQLSDEANEAIEAELNQMDR
jgi:peroxin-5